MLPKNVCIGQSGWSKFSAMLGNLQHASCSFVLVIGLMVRPCFLHAESVCKNTDDNIQTISVAAPPLDQGNLDDSQNQYFEFINLIYKPVGIDVSMRMIPAIRINKLLKEKKIDAAFSYYSSDFAAATGVDFYLTPQKAINVERLVAICKKNMGEWRFPESLLGKRISWIPGYQFETILPITYEYQMISSQLQGLSLLELGRIDCYIDDEDDIGKLLAEYGIGLDHYAVHLILVNKLYLAFAKTPKSGALMSLFDCRMEEARQSGELASFYRRWDLPWPPAQ